MKLIWKKKLYWREADGKLYIHPVLAFAIIIGFLVILSQASAIPVWIIDAGL